MTEVQAEIKEAWEGREEVIQPSVFLRSNPEMKTRRAESYFSTIAFLNPYIYNCTFSPFSFIPFPCNIYCLSSGEFCNLFHS